MFHRSPPCIRLQISLKFRAAKRLALLIICLATGLQAAQTTKPTAKPPQDALQPILTYIHAGWDTLTRSMTQCESVVDPKISTASVLYLPADVATPASVENMQKQCRVDIEHLPLVIHGPGEVDPRKLPAPGLLYLPNKYVVPGGRFNEMYGWDSYFIILGLLRDGRLDLARGMVENFFFEIEHYGTFLNANRTYFLTRSQPPFLSSMIMAVHDAEHSAGHDDRAWMEKAYSYASRDYAMWNREPHLAGDTGLSRYFDFGEGPVQEGLQDETGFYRNVAAYFLDHPQAADHDLITTKPNENNPEAVGFLFTLQLCEAVESGPKCEPFKTVSLSRDYYKGDRAMRESGFDVSFRFGPFSAQTHHYAPVCLNSLLYKTEKDLEQIAGLLGKKEDATTWAQRAQTRKQRIDKYLWDSAHGMYFDYNFETQSRSTYDYITMLYPLWAGAATPEQASAIQKNLRIIEYPGGLAMSHNDTGGQWDLPYGWAPTQLVAIKGLRRYGFNEDANRISYKFLLMINQNFGRDATLREKYNVVNRSSETHVSVGYHQNVVGFGWTNAAFLELLHDLPEDWQQKLEAASVPAK
jgi:alpha,alpha-trehalase